MVNIISKPFQVSIEYRLGISPTHNNSNLKLRSSVCVVISVLLLAAFAYRFEKNGNPMVMYVPARQLQQRYKKTFVYLTVIFLVYFCTVFFLDNR